MFIPEPQISRIADAINEMGEMERRDGDVVLILLGEKDAPDIQQLIARLDHAGVDFLGGVFPGIIHGTHSHEQGAVITALPAVEKPFLVRGLETDPIELPDFGGRIPGDGGGDLTALILVDGLTSNIALFLEEMYNRFGNSVNYFGGGAGSLSLEQAPCLFTRDGLFQDAAIVAFLRLRSNLGVRHGWEKLMGPLVATRTQKNIVCELNWRNAFEVYREAVEADSGTEFTADNFFDIAKGYPFGLLKEGLEDIVRDPLAVNEKGELVCVGEVPENATLSILKGHGASLIRAAGQAVDDCLVGERHKACNALVVDCISRILFLEDDFPRELEVITEKVRSVAPDLTPEGMLTLGEISSYGEGFLEFFNKTTVVGMFHDE